VNVPGQPRFRDRTEFGPTIDAAGERLGISPTAVEKDYWVSEVLRVMASEFAGDFILKGGTSLSKGYRLIQRFSEDIDILVLPGSRGRDATDKLMKRMSDRAAAGVGGTATRFGEAETGRHRSYDIHYPTLRSATDLIRTSVLLEMGVRGGAEPSDSMAIGYVLGDVLAEAGTDLSDFSDLGPFEVVVLHPGRTLLEKLVGVHAEARRLAADPFRAADRRTGRHFYDIYELLADQPVRDLLADRSAVERILEEVAATTLAHFTKPGETVEVRPPGGFANSPAFKLASDVSERLRAAYEETMPELYFGTGRLPSWEAIARRVIENRGLL
jgi:predicted nucleotidyltransferase component of viral defense system